MAFPAVQHEEKREAHGASLDRSLIIEQFLAADQRLLPVNQRLAKVLH
jgi:hypothetical protein